ncbi:MAG: hypothetical protein LBU85_03070 [Treponema sp.]|nr:hypothetical protein [Treponema sp.]
MVSAKIINAAEDYKDNFFSNKFDLIDDEKTAHLREIRANTPEPFSILLLGCQNLKDKPKNYCDILFNPEAVKKACESNKVDYVFFYINKWLEEKSENKPNETPVYILAFARYSKTDEEIHKKIIAEVKRTKEWLCISGKIIQCYVFYYANSPCNTFDRGALKKKYDDLCTDKKYIFQFQYVFINKRPQYISVNEGFPQFTIKVQEM